MRTYGTGEEPGRLQSRPEWNGAAADEVAQMSGHRQDTWIRGVRMGSYVLGVAELSRTTDCLDHDLAVEQLVAAGHTVPMPPAPIERSSR